MSKKEISIEEIKAILDKRGSTPCIKGYWRWVI